MYFLLQGILLVGASEKVPPKVYFRAQQVPKNGPKMDPKRVPKWAPEGRPRLPKGHIGALHGPASSRGLLLKAFVCCWFWLCSCLCFWFWFCFLCVCCCFCSFIRSCCMSLCVLVFGCVFCFLLLCFCFMPSSSRCSKTALQILGATSKRHATCSRMPPSGLVEMLIRLECGGSAPVVMVPL